MAAAARLPSAVENAPYEHDGSTAPYQSGKNVLSAQLSMVPDCVSPRPLAAKTRRKEETLISALCAFVVDHQIGLSINLLLLLTFTHILFPRARRRTRKFYELSYYDEPSGQYMRGWDDLCLVFFYIVVFTGLRAATMDHVLMPLARMGGVGKKKASVRFAEQGWLLLYYFVFWSLGMYLMYNSKYWLNMHELWTDYPLRTMTGPMKWYYLAQYAFWLQQILVINIEERRKDHWQMFTHHIITCMLMFASYSHYMVRVGNLILCIMDSVDIILPAAKMLRYLGYRTACDIAFGIFMLTWFIARHVFFLMVCWSIYTQLPVVLIHGCYDSASGDFLSRGGGTDIARNLMQAFINPGGPVCYNTRINNMYLTLLLALQCITIVWFGMIVRVAWNVIRGHGADDSRSDDEGEEEDEEMDIEEKIDVEAMKGKQKMPMRGSPSPNGSTRIKKPLEEEVGAESLHFSKRKSTKPQRRSSGRSSGIQIPGHSDRKDILDRIGCERKTNE